MKLEHFLSDQSAQDAMRKASVICLQVKEYPLLFCHSLIAFLAKKFAISITPHYMDSDNNEAVMASLQTTFLGQTLWYWLHGDTSLTKKSADTWYDFLRSYKGPNTLIFCATKPVGRVPASWYVLQLPDAIDSSYFKYVEQIITFKQPSFSANLFKVVRTMSLDTAWLMCYYGLLLNKNNQLFLDTWLPHLIMPEVSLFALSQALFDRKPRQFFMHWQRMSSLYSPQFWISFWSEQLWRACCYIRLQKEGKRQEAKQIGYRLPFAFLNNGWRSYSVTELQQAHMLLYDIDYHLKQGGTEYSLELLYAQFLNKSW